MPIPLDFMEQIRPPRIQHYGNTTWTLPTTHKFGPYQYWRGALVYDARRLLKLLEGNVAPLDTAHPAHVPDETQAAEPPAIPKPRVARGATAAGADAGKVVSEE